MARELPSRRNARQALERKLFVEALRQEGFFVDEEVPFKGMNGKRKWRIDIVADERNDEWPSGRPPPLLRHSIAIEIEGLNGRHQFTAGFIRDMEKYNELALCGYRLLRFTTRQIADGTALETLARAGVGTK